MVFVTNEADNWLLLAADITILLNKLSTNNLAMKHWENKTPSWYGFTLTTEVIHSSAKELR